MEREIRKLSYRGEYTYESSPFSASSWIAPSYSVDTAVITRSFVLNNDINAKLFITAFGYFEAKINGHPLSKDKFIPVASDYHARDLKDATYEATDKRSYRVYYYEYEIGPLLKSGENTLEINLGGGWYSQSERIAEGRMQYGDRPKCIYTIAGSNDKIFSDGNEIWRESEIRSSNIFIGETIDYTYRGLNDKNVITYPHPDETVFTPEMGVPDGIIRTINPKLIFSSPNKNVYDIGENISALVTITTNAPYGERYILRFAERIHEDFTLDFTSTGAQYIGASGKNQIMTDEFVTDGKRRIFTPKFVWHAFRYFEIIGDTGCIEPPIAEVIHADIPITCDFSSDSEGANFLFDAYIRTQLSNYHGSFPSDCPHRERLGYTGDGQLCAKAAMMLTASEKLYEKWILDILDGQDKVTGHVQHTAPFQGGGGGPGGWCSAIVTVPYTFYKQYGKSDIVKRAIPAMELWITFTASCMENGLVVREKEGGWCLGDWCMKPGAALPEPFVNTCWFVHTLRLYKELTCALGFSPKEEFLKLENECLSAVRREYSRLSDIGAANAYAAWIGIDTAEKCARYYDKLGCFDTGFLGTDILMEVLFKNGYADVAGKLLASREEGSFLHMKDRGSTTIWERWKIGSSESHPMFGASCRQLFEGILGIVQAEGSECYEKVIISPTLPSSMSYAKGSILTPRGRISVAVRRKDGKVEIDASVPEGIEYSIVSEQASQITEP